MDKYFYYGLNPEFNWTEDQFKIILADHIESLDILGYLGNVMYEKKIKDLPYKYYSETLVYRYFYQSINLNSLLKETFYHSKIFNYEMSFFDISSSNIIQRSLFELYLTFYYLYIQPKSENERRCKWLIYQIAGLNSRQDLSSNYVEFKSKIANEKNIIAQCTEELRCNEFFLLLPIADQKDFLKGNRARIIGWKKLFESSELNSELFIKAWCLYSNYAHSEFISLIQLKEYQQKSPEIFDTKQIIAFISLLLCAVFITDVRKLYKEIDETFEKLPNNQKECINFLDGIGRKSNS